MKVQPKSYRGFLSTGCLLFWDVNVSRMKISKGFRDVNIFSFQGCKCVFFFRDVNVFFFFGDANVLIWGDVNVFLLRDVNVFLLRGCKHLFALGM